MSTVLPPDVASVAASTSMSTCLTPHALGRGARRNVMPDAVDYVLEHGMRLHRTGVTFCFLRWRDIPPADRRATWAARLEGTVVVMGAGDIIITVYRNRQALHTINRKMKYRLAGFAPQGVQWDARRWADPSPNSPTASSVA